MLPDFFGACVPPITTLCVASPLLSWRS